MILRSDPKPLTLKNMIKAVRDQDFHSAAREMKDSRWYHQVGKRAQRLEEMMLDAAEAKGATT